MNFIQAILVVGFCSYFGYRLAILCLHFWQSKQLKHINQPLQVDAPLFCQPGVPITVGVRLNGASRPVLNFITTTRLVLVIDNSSAFFGEPQKQALWGALTIAEHCALAPADLSVAVVAINEQAKLLQSFTHDEQVLQKVITERLPTPEGSKNLAQGLLMALSLFRLKPNEVLAGNRPDAVNDVVVLLTDITGQQQNDSRLNETCRQLTDTGVQLFVLSVAGAENGRVSSDQRGIKPAEALSTVPTFGCDGKGVSALMVKISGLSQSLVGDSELTIWVARHSGVGFLTTTSAHPITSFNPLIYTGVTATGPLQQVTFDLKAPDNWGEYALFTMPAKITLSNIGENAATQSLTFAAQDVPKIIVTPPGPSILWALLLPRRLLSWWVKKVTENSQRNKGFSVNPPDKPNIGHLKQLKVDHQRKFNPCFCIALGGGGIASAMRIQSFCSDLNGGYYPDEALKMLWIDSELQLEHHADFGSCRKDYVDYVSIGRDLWTVHRELLSAPASDQQQVDYPAHWNSAFDSAYFDTRTGCHRNRSLGALSLNKNLETSKEIEHQLVKGIQWFKEKSKVAGVQGRVVILTSTSGGTGSAIFAPISQMLLQQLEANGLEHQSIVAVLNESPPIDSGLFQQRQKQNAANHWAFLLELERLKATIEHNTLNDPKNRLKNPRFTENEYLAAAGDNEMSSFESSAGLVSAWVAGQGPFSDLLYKDSHQASQQGNGLVRFSLKNQIIPLTLLRQYVIDALSLQLLSDVCGLRLQDEKYLCHQEHDEQRQDQYIGWLLRDVRIDGFAPIGDKVPLLFNYIQSLCDADPEDEAKDIVDVVVGALIQCGPYYKQAELEKQRVLACQRTLLWCFAILNQNHREQSLAQLISVLATLEHKVYLAMERVRSVSLGENLPDEQIVFFSVARLTQLWGLLGHYQQIFKRLQKDLSSWNYTLGERFPDHWSVYPKPSSNYVGLMRRLARRIALVRSRLVDYRSLMQGYDENSLLALAQELTEQHRQGFDEQQWQSLKACFSWQLDENFAQNDSGDLELSVLINPFCLMLNGADDSEAKISCAGQGQVQFEKQLNDLFEYVLPGFENLQLVPQTPNSPMLELSEAIANDYDIGISNKDISDQATDFAVPIAAMKMAMGSNLQFRQMAIYRKAQSSDSLSLGKRFHRFAADITANAIQQAAMIREPIDPLIIPLLSNPHWLQRFIYLCLQNRVAVKDNTTDSANWEVDFPLLNGTRQWYRLGQVGQQQSIARLVSAAGQFITQKQPLGQQQRFDLADSWRPDDDERQALDNWCRKGYSHLPEVMQNFLRQCESLTTLMNNEQGYVQWQMLQTHASPLD